MTDAERSAEIEEAAAQLMRVAAEFPDWPETWAEHLDALADALALVPPPPTLAERIAAPTLPAEVDRAREILDAKDRGWNEGVEAALEIAEEPSAFVEDKDQTRERKTKAKRIRSLLIPTVPPTKEGT